MPPSRSTFGKTPPKVTRLATVTESSPADQQPTKTTAAQEGTSDSDPDSDAAAERLLGQSEKELESEEESATSERTSHSLWMSPFEVQWTQLGPSNLWLRRLLQLRLKLPPFKRCQLCLRMLLEWLLHLLDKLSARGGSEPSYLSGSNWIRYPGSRYRDCGYGYSLHSGDGGYLHQGGGTCAFLVSGTPLDSNHFCCCCHTRVGGS